MRTPSRTLCFLALLAITVSPPVHATTSTFIVYMTAAGDNAVSATAATDRYTSTLLTAMQSTGDSTVLDTDSDVELTYVYDSYAAFAAPMSSVTAEALRSDPEVLAVVPDGTVNPQTTHTPAFLGLEKGLLWGKSKRGGDVIVGVIDSGAWPESASFGDAGVGPVPKKWKGVCQLGEKWVKTNCNRKLVGARYFYKGHMAAEGVNRTNQILSARDTQGHGSHTASTATGTAVPSASLNGLGKGHPARGMAEQARVAVYKVCWPKCYGSDILAAYDAAVKDGVDVITVSLGAEKPADYIQEANTVGSFGAIKAGIFVANSAGNSGGNASTVANTAPWVMTVAASTVDRDFFAGVQLGNGKKIRGKSWTPGNWGSYQYPLIRGLTAKLPSAPDGDADNCMANSLNPTLVKDKIVVCQYQFGFNLPAEKAQAVLARGARGLIIINFDDELYPAHYVLPTVVVGFTLGQTILAYLQTAKPTAVLYPETVLGVKPAPAVASFSSRGPSKVNPKVLKPDVTAPGVKILAAWTESVAPTNITKDPHRIKYNIISGTSMATPHVAGLAALLKGAYPKWSPAAIKSALMTSATVLDNRGGHLTDLWTSGSATPFDYGAGHVVPEKARTPGLLYDISVRDYINFLCAFGYTAKEVQVFYGSPVTCPKIPVRSEDFNYPTFSATFAQSVNPVTVRFTRNVTNVGPATIAYTAVVKAPAGVKIVVSPTVLQFSKYVHTRSFTLTVSTIGAPKTAFGSLTWTAPGGLYVQSPIVITPAVVAT